MFPFLQTEKTWRSHRANIARTSSSSSASVIMRRIDVARWAPVALLELSVLYGLYMTELAESQIAQLESPCDSDVEITLFSRNGEKTQEATAPLSFVSSERLHARPRAVNVLACADQIVRVGWVADTCCATVRLFSAVSTRN